MTSLALNRPPAAAKVVLVDDDVASLDSLAFWLSAEGFDVAQYRRPEDLLAAAIPPIACLVTDYHMPSMNGLELVARLAERGHAVPALLLTAEPADHVRARAAQLGVTIVLKPALGPRLTSLIRHRIDGAPENSTSR